MLKGVSNHLIQQHVIPWLLLPVVMSGLACFAVFGLPDAFHSSSNSDVVGLTVASLLGILGSSGTFALLCTIRRKAPDWTVFELGRTAWLTLIILAWFAGLGCGGWMLHEI
jgi:hypothetical protein